MNTNKIPGNGEIHRRVLIPGNPHLIDVKIDLRGIQSKGAVPPIYESKG